VSACVLSEHQAPYVCISFRSAEVLRETRAESRLETGCFIYAPVLQTDISLGLPLRNILYLLESEPPKIRLINSPFPLLAFSIFISRSVHALFQAGYICTPDAFILPRLNRVVMGLPGFASGGAPPGRLITASAGVTQHTLQANWCPSRADDDHNASTYRTPRALVPPVSPPN